jgi:hypothetical protein
MTAGYIQPCQPPSPPPPTQTNSYRTPSAPQPPQPSPPTPLAHDQDPRRGTLFAEWRRWHGSDWVRADELTTAVRRMIDERERLPAIRQRLRLLVNKPSDGFTLEAKTVGNRARPVAFYRLVKS